MDLRNKDEAGPRVIVISDKKGGLPFSKGILASSISVTGLDIITAHKIALEIQDYFLKNKIYSLSLGELRSLAFRFIKDRVSLEYAERYLLWQSVGKLEKPIIILIGGSTGVGKSTIATILANRLNVTRVVSTDAIREIMRTSVSKKLISSLKGSSYNAYESLTFPPSGEEPVILGFKEQASAVNVGIEAIMERNILEKSDVIIEGAHVVPGYLNLDQYSSRAVIQQIVISVPDKEVHKEHFIKRTVETQGLRPMQKYIKHIDKIIMIQNYIEKLAKKKNVRIIENYDLDNVVNRVSELIFQRVKSEFSKVGSEYTKVN